MIVALLNQKGVGKTTRALHLADQSARQGKRITLIDAAPQGLAPDWSEQRARRRFDGSFGDIGLARNRPHTNARKLARCAEHVIIDGPPWITSLLRSALLTAHLAFLRAFMAGRQLGIGCRR